MMIREKPTYPFLKKVQIHEGHNINNRAKECSMTLTSSLEKMLISGLKNGDSQAFSNIFQVYFRDLVIFASRFTREINNAEEIVEDIFVALWEERESIDIKSSLKSYLLKTVQNKCIDWLRHKKIIEAHNEYTLLNSPRFTANTDTYLLYSELTEQIETALKLIPKDASEAFRMNREKGLKYHQIAGILGVSIRTVEVRIGRALSLLRYHLKDYLAMSITVSLLIN